MNCVHVRMKLFGNLGRNVVCFGWCPRPLIHVYCQLDWRSPQFSIKFHCYLQTKPDGISLHFVRLYCWKPGWSRFTSMMARNGVLVPNDWHVYQVMLWPTFTHWHRQMMVWQTWQAFHLCCVFLSSPRIGSLCCRHAIIWICPGEICNMT